ncbi:radical SAM protein [candidate division CSSED10-310 bacterium]|uniref:Radical SAM protein n=1 Tax=candidate division CSSED10-310 bacterium TaxID=2855610 RepID=A0ABV6YV47_UNCC1
MPAFDWIQIEVSTFCNASCIYCPHTCYEETWLNKHFPLSLFKNLIPYFMKGTLIYLQGWGEPLLNPEFFTMVNLAKKAGCFVGTTTNGNLFTEKTFAQVLDSGIDIVSFSLAGTDERNDAIRSGTSIGEVVEAIRGLNSLKRSRALSKPALHIAYLLLRSQQQKLARLPDLLTDLGIENVIISALDFVPTAVPAPPERVRHVPYHLVSSAGETDQKALSARPGMQHWEPPEEVELHTYALWVEIALGVSDGAFRSEHRKIWST